MYIFDHSWAIVFLTAPRGRVHKIQNHSCQSYQVTNQQPPKGALQQSYNMQNLSVEPFSGWTKTRTCSLTLGTKTASRNREQIGGETQPVRACMYRKSCPCWAALIRGIHRILIPTKMTTKTLNKGVLNSHQLVQLEQSQHTYMYSGAPLSGRISSQPIVRICEVYM